MVLYLSCYDIWLLLLIMICSFYFVETHWPVCKSICLLIRAIHLCRAYEHIVLVHYRDVLEVWLLFSFFGNENMQFGWLTIRTFLATTSQTRLHLWTLVCAVSHLNLLIAYQGSISVSARNDSSTSNQNGSASRAEVHSSPGWTSELVLPCPNSSSAELKGIG